MRMNGSALDIVGDLATELVSSSSLLETFRCYSQLRCTHSFNGQATLVVNPYLSIGNSRSPDLRNKGSSELPSNV